MEQKVIALQPTDYNSDHTVLGGYRTQLQAAHSDNVAAYKWFVLADAAGDGRARNEQKKLAASMRPKEIAEAESRASAWLSGRRSPFQLVKSANR